MRSGAQKACIWATFVRIPDSVKKQLEKCGCEANDDLLLYREINAEGKGSCRVNGMPATAEMCIRDRFQLPHGKKLKEMVGHTPIEVLTGAALGIVLGFAMPMV